MSAQVYVYDCTLRDGTQGADVSLSVADKIRIAQRLDVFGVHYIEGGWPGSNPTDVEFFKRAASLEWDRSKICAFGSTRHFKHRVDQDPNLEALLAAQTPVLTVVAKGWDFHVEKVLGISLEENLTLIRESRIKELEFEGAQFEGADASLKLLIREFGEHKGDPFEFTGFRVFIDQVSGEFLSEATVKVSVEGSQEHTAADGNGPVDALDRAIKKAVARFFPEVEKIRLTDYKVRVLDAREGTAARVRVLIESTDGIETWSTVGVSHNVIEASWRAITDSILYKLVFLSSGGSQA